MAFGNRWRDNEPRSAASDRGRDEYGGREGGGREERYGRSDWESGDNYGERARGYGGEGYGGGRQSYGSERYRSQGQGYQGQGYGSDPGRGWGSEERERQSDFPSTRYGASEYDYRGGAYGTAGSYDEGFRERSGYGMHRGRGPRNYRRSDERIREDVCDCLTEDPRIDASSIDVAVTDGEVVLTGVVFVREDKRRTEDLIERISGVKDVRNNLRVSSERSEQSSGQTKGAQGPEGQQGGQSGQSPRH